MKLIAFSVHDSKAKAFVQPFFTPTQATGLRSFRAAVNDPSTMFSRHAGDYTLFEIGEFYIETGILKPHNVHINHGLAVTFKGEETTDA